MVLLNMTPSRSGYRVGVSSGYDTTDVMAGSPRYRSVMTGVPHRVAVQWNTNPAGLSYLTEFYQSNIDKAFEINLPIDTAELTEYTAYFLPGSFQLRGINGNVYSIEAQLEIVLSDDADFRRELGVLQNLYPTDLADMIRLTRRGVELLSRVC